MSARPEPLSPGTILKGRFEVEQTLGQGNFGITYRASDRSRGDTVVLRELAPLGSERLEGGRLVLTHAGEPTAQRLRHVFNREARKLSRSSGRGLLPVRANFVELGTAFLVREHLPDAMTLAERILQDGRQSPAFVEQLLTDLGATLDRVHDNGLLHLDIRPSNILVASSGTPYLVDFGEARKWWRDLLHAGDWVEGMPPELALKNSRFGAYTDVFELGSTLYTALAGFPPPTSGEASPTAIGQVRPDVPTSLEERLSWALEINPGKRPRSAAAMLAGRKHPPQDPKAVLEEFDRKAVLLKTLKFGRRQCPSCGDVLEEPKPLKPKVCPVCHEGVIRMRKVVERLCPQCREGILKERPNLEPLSVCPLCSTGLLVKRKKSLFKKEFVYACPECEAAFEWHEPSFKCVSEGDHCNEEHSCQEWRERSHRAPELWHCPACEAQYDRLEDGRWKQAVPSKVGRYDALEPAEWARVAAGLPPDAGNAECDACGADYYVEGEDVALLESPTDPHGFAAVNKGRLLTFEELRWVGVGKESPQGGLVCHNCDTEFDLLPDGLRLVRTPNDGMLEYFQATLSLENWHRAAKELPLAGQEKTFEEPFGIALREAFLEGHVPFSSKDPDLIWKGSATRLAEGEKPSEGQLTITTKELRFGGLLKKTSYDMSGLQNVEVEGSTVRLHFAESEVLEFDIAEIELSAQLQSGIRTVTLRADDLAARLRALISRRERAATPQA